MTEEQLLDLIKEIGLDEVIKRSFRENFPYTSNQVIQIYRSRNPPTEK